MLTAVWGGRGGGGPAWSSRFRRRRDAEGCCGRMQRAMRMQTPGGVVAMSWQGREAVGRRGRRHPHVHGARKRRSGRREREWPQGAQGVWVVYSMDHAWELQNDGNDCSCTQGQHSACGGREATNTNNKSRTCATAPTHFPSNPRLRRHRYYRRNEYARSCERTCCSACARVGTHHLGGRRLLRRRVYLSTRWTACSDCPTLCTLRGRILSRTPHHR